jgi:hypothetical protein
MDRDTHVTSEQPQDRGRYRAHIRMGMTLAVLSVLAVATVLGSRALSAATGPNMRVQPSTTVQLYYQPQPFGFTVQAQNFSGTGLTPVLGYQDRLEWDAKKIQWMSGPRVGPGTPTPVPVVSCTQLIAVPTATLEPHITPTITPTFTPTPGEGTPTWTPTGHTATPTATPSGAIVVGCATLGQTPPTPHPSGTLGTFMFQPLHDDAPYTASLMLKNVKYTAFLGTPIPGTSNSGIASFIVCPDVNGDGVVTVSDVTMTIAAFGSTEGDPNWVPAADFDGSGTITVGNVTTVVAGFGFVC